MVRKHAVRAFVTLRATSMILVLAFHNLPSVYLPQSLVIFLLCSYKILRFRQTLAVKRQSELHSIVCVFVADDMCILEG